MNQIFYRFFTFFQLEILKVRLHRMQSNAKQHEMLSNTKQSNFDVIGNLRKVATGRKYRMRFLNLVE